MRVTRVFVCLVVFVAAVNSYALASRSWVAGDGDDLNSCAYTAPCKTFAGAISKTETGGMISVKSPGAFGAVTISKSITIDGGGNFASVLYPSGDGITINFPANDGFGNNVVLRGLSITSSFGGGFGVMVTGSMAVNVAIVDTTFTRCGAAVGMAPGGAGSTLRMDNVEASNLSIYGVIVSPPAGTPLRLTMNNVRIGDSGTGSQYDGGVRIVANTNGTISDCKFQNGYNGILIENANVHVSVVRTVLSENVGSGLHHEVAGITTVLDGCSIVGNMVGVSNVGGSVIGFGNNAIAYNNQDVMGNAIQTIQGK